jgi:hypothetical protein
MLTVNNSRPQSFEPMLRISLVYHKLGLTTDKFMYVTTQIITDHKLYMFCEPRCVCIPVVTFQLTRCRLQESKPSTQHRLGLVRTPSVCWLLRLASVCGRRMEMHVCLYIQSSCVC